MKRSLLLPSLFLLAVFTISLHSQTVVKRVLVEEFTGAWCPWCIDGPVQLDLIHQKVGDQLIAVAIHDNDSMTTDEYNNGGWKPMAPFYPAGMVNRVFYSDEDSKKVGIDRANWEKRVNEELAKPALVDVFVSKNKYDNITNELTVTVEATFVTAVSGDVRLNAYIVENKIVGKGVGYDQANAYNKLTGSESHPWYGKGSPVIGYEHNHVFRKAMGGAWGLAGSVPSPIVPGKTISYTFSCLVPSNWNPDNLEVVGLVEMYDADANKCEILNSYELEIAPSPTKILSSGGFLVTQPSVSQSYTFTVSNQSDKDQTYVVSSTKSSRTPTDWNASVAGGNEFTVAAHSRSVLTATMTVGSTVGIGDLSVVLSPKDDPLQVYGAIPFTLVHNGCTSMELLLQGNRYSINDAVKSAGKSGYWAIDATNPQVWSEMNKLTRLDNLVVNTGDQGIISDAAILSVQRYIDGGANTLITGNLAAQNFIKNSEFASEAGLAGDVQSGVGVNSKGELVAFKADGVSYDPIADEMLFDCKLVDSKISVLDFSFPANATPMIVLHGTTNAIATHFQHYNSRCVILPNPQIFGAQSNKLLARTLTWLEANSATAKPVLRIFDNADPMTLEFGEVEPGKTKSLDYVLRNTGKAPLEVKSFEWLNGSEDESVFSITNVSVPFTIQPGQTQSLKIAFTPKSADFEVGTVLNVISDAPNKPELPIGINAKALNVADVEPNLSDDGLLTIRTYPNPATDFIRLEVLNASHEKLAFSLVDVFGNQTSVTPIQMYGPIILDVSQLSSGSYRLLITAGVHSTFAPIVVLH